MKEKNFTNIIFISSSDSGERAGQVDASIVCAHSEEVVVEIGGRAGQDGSLVDNRVAQSTTVTLGRGEEWE